MLRRILFPKNLLQILQSPCDAIYSRPTVMLLAADGSIARGRR